MKLCRRCLLSEMESEKPLYQLIREVIDSLPEDTRAEEATYRARLAACKSCDKLTGGMCTLCGCYVEVRAAKKPMYCPDLHDRWMEVSIR